MTEIYDPRREIPDAIWWCFKCQGGVGVWPAYHVPPPRCPDCHEADFAPVRFMPDVAPATPLLDAVRAQVRAARPDDPPATRTAVFDEMTMTLKHVDEEDSDGQL